MNLKKRLSARHDDAKPLPIWLPMPSIVLMCSMPSCIAALSVISSVSVMPPIYGPEYWCRNMFTTFSFHGTSDGLRTGASSAEADLGSYSFAARKGRAGRSYCTPRRGVRSGVYFLFIYPNSHKTQEIIQKKYTLVQSAALCSPR